MHRKVNLTPPATYYRQFQVGAFAVVPSNLMFASSVFLVLLLIMYVSLFSYLLIPESPPTWERAADSIYHLSFLFTNITSCCDFFPLIYCGRSLGSCCISS